MGKTRREARGRGARKRRRSRAGQKRAAKIAWWTQPGVLIFVAVLALAIAGWVLVIRSSQRIPSSQARIDGLELHLQEARWILDQMDHGENFQKPSVMMPDMPEWGKQRVTLDLAFFNRADSARTYRGEEFFLVPEIGEEVPPIGAQTGRAELQPGQAFNTALHFDFDTTVPHGRLHVEWRRRDEVAYLPIPEPAEHYHLRPRGGEVALPPEARFVEPLGRSERGAELYNAVYGCVACHGDPAVPGSNNVGPHLGGIGTVAASRVEGMPASQYIYESIIDPGAFIAPECKDGLPCAEPTAMPEYASLVNLQDLADLLVYLLSLQDTDAEAAAGS